MSEFPGKRTKEVKWSQEYVCWRYWHVNLNQNCLCLKEAKVQFFAAHKMNSASIAD